LPKDFLKIFSLYVGTRLENFIGPIDQFFDPSFYFEKVRFEALFKDDEGEEREDRGRA
jgi:hypothetical protein